MAITPDGKVLAYVTDVGGKRTVIVYSIDVLQAFGRIWWLAIRNFAICAGRTTIIC